MNISKHLRWEFALLAASCLPLMGACTISAAVTIQTVPVGDAGNAADTTGYGSVNYAYNIGKYDVTCGQYTAFLNAVAGVDTYALYSLNMLNGGTSTAYGCGITQNGAGTVANPYTYTVAADFVNRPIVYVTYWDATRFANWLDNGQPTGAEGPGTTETGTYTLTSAGINNNTVTCNAGATWAVTSENEWYKAAYYKGGGTDAGYWEYPTQSNTAPGNNLADSTGNDANYYTGSGPYPIDNGYYTTPVGQFANSPSAYGTFDQGGDVWNWTEPTISGSSPGLRGGSFNIAYASVNYLQSDNRGHDVATDDTYDIGFRVTEVPEPASLAVLSLAVMEMMVRRKGVRR